MQIKPYMVYADSEEEFNNLIRRSKDDKMHLRIGLSIKDKQGSKIGISIKNITRILATKGNYVQSLHYHAGTQQTSVNKMVDTLNTILRLLKKQDKMINLRSINIGGGFPSFAHMPAGYLRKLFPTIRNLLEQSPDDFGNDIDLCMEPGRLLVADAGILLTRVKAIKKDNPDSWLFLDAGMNAINKQFSKARVRFLIANRMRDSYNHPFNITGPLPSRVDTFTKHYPLPKKTKVGDPVIITNAGAYTLPFLMNFCFPKPSITILD
jgi:diaminopimelate decarboxylase